MLLKSFRNVFINAPKYNCKEKEFFSLLRNKGIESSHNQTRNVTIVKRRHPAPLVKLNKSWRSAKLADMHHIYDEVEVAETDKKTLRLLLIKPVQELGQPGEVVEVDPNVGRITLLLTGLAVYASPENLKKYENLKSSTTVDVPSSSHALKTFKILESTPYSVTMNLETPWQIEKWHVRVGLRKGLINSPDDSAITIPDKPITGPDPNLEGKEFLAKVKINNKEEARIRVRIHHVSTEKMNRLPYVEKHWLKRAEPVFPDDLEQVAILNELNDNDPALIASEDDE